jgi:microcystin-dependent protein
MSQPFIGEIRIWACDYAPRGFAFCNGQVLPIRQNEALYAVLENNFGGDGHRTFALPDLRGRSPLAAGQGAGLTHRPVGEKEGQQAVQLQEGELPVHDHAVQCVSKQANTTSPVNKIWATGAGSRGQNFYASSPGRGQAMFPHAAFPAGSGMPHNNMPPYLGLNFCIALEGAPPDNP